jgi:hypothetical protein
MGPPRGIYDWPNTRSDADFIGITNLSPWRSGLPRARRPLGSYRPARPIAAVEGRSSPSATSASASGSQAAGLGVSLQAVVRDAFFVGSSIQHVLTAPGGPELTAEVRHMAALSWRTHSRFLFRVLAVQNVPWR